MALTASKLRENIYRVLDQVLETGEPVEIERAERQVPGERAEAESVSYTHLTLPTSDLV